MTSQKIFKFMALTLIFGYVMYYNVMKKTILVLHSYNVDYSWVTDINEGINRALSLNKTNVNIVYHYMNTKNYPNPESLKKAGMIGTSVVEMLKPNIILAIDDDAQKYVAIQYKNHSHIKIIYAGVNNQPENYGYPNTPNITGVLERLPIQAIKDFAKTIFQGKKDVIRVCHVSANSPVVNMDDKNMHSYPDWAPLKLIPSRLADTFDEWKENIRTAKDSMDLMLISNYRRIYTDKTMTKLVPYKEVMQWAYENSPVPILGINGFVCEDGAAIAIGTSPFAQGMISMQMALDLATGKKDIKDIPVEAPQMFIVLINEERFAEKYTKNGMTLPIIYEAFARATNKYTSHQQYIK